jgi:hypothetical protein
MMNCDEDDIKPTALDKRAAKIIKSAARASVVQNQPYYKICVYML